MGEHPEERSPIVVDLAVLIGDYVAAVIAWE
jgi:hypothetical protein